MNICEGMCTCRATGAIEFHGCACRATGARNSCIMEIERMALYRFMHVQSDQRCSYFVYIFEFSIYIYIYIEREREREI